MFPITIEVKGREEPIDATHVAASELNGIMYYFMVTPDGRIASVREEDLLIYWDNQPSEDAIKHVIRMEQEGIQSRRQRKEDYKGNEFS